MDRGEFQQDSVLKQLEVLKEEEKEFQNLKVRIAAGCKSQAWKLGSNVQASATDNDRKPRRAGGHPGDKCRFSP